MRIGNNTKISIDYTKNFDKRENDKTQRLQ